MAFTPNLTTTFLILTVLVVLLPAETYAFGAGDIPEFSYLNDKAFRHGDIEGILETLVKSAGGAAASGGLLGFAKSVLESASGGAKFTKSDVKKVYFGNWLRDYSQAMDIAGLSKLTAETLVLVVSVLGFMTFGFATEEFQVTADRLGVYLPVEHIDNPKGYAAKEGDARQYHPKLRPPVEDVELEIDENTGMKNYMATENREWDTSTGFIRRTFIACIEHGRSAGGENGPDLYEAYRLLGTGLHTLEDLLAHSNWCEVALRKMGHQDVFCHVGDNVIINTPNGEAPPLVTGTFGGADFIYSLMGEATDKLSQVSVTDLTQKMNQASQEGGDTKFEALKAIFGKLSGGNEDSMDDAEKMQSQSKAYHFDPDNVAPPEVQHQLLDLLKWRDNVYRDVVKKIEMVPGLSNILEELTNALNAFVYTLIAPYITPILQQATAVLGEGSKGVLESGDQFEVFDNDHASDPTHSVLSKDHFDLILNEPAGRIAQIVVEHAVNLIVRAWSDDSDPNEVIEQVLEAFHHPYYETGQSRVQRAMFDHMEGWFNGLDDQQEILRRLTKESVREGKNKRPGSESQSGNEGGHSHGGHSHGGGYSGGNQTSGGYQSQQSYGGSGHQQGYGGRQDQQQYGGYQSQQSYGGGSGYQPSYGREDNNDSYAERHGSRRNDDESENRYSRNEEGGAYSQGRHDNQYGGNSENRYGSNRNDDASGYRGGHQDESESYSRRDAYDSSYNRSNDNEHVSRRRDEDNSYGYQRQESSGYAPSYSQPSQEEYSTSGYGRNDGDSYGTSGGYGRQQEYSSYGGNDETYGAERLNIGDDEDEDRHGHRHHHNDDYE